jgi:hypothetical protein
MTEILGQLALTVKLVLLDPAEQQVPSGPLALQGRKV